MSRVRIVYCDYRRCGKPFKTTAGRTKYCPGTDHDRLERTEREADKRREQEAVERLRIALRECQRESWPERWAPEEEMELATARVEYEKDERENQRQAESPGPIRRARTCECSRKTSTYADEDGCPTCRRCGLPKVTGWPVNGYDATVALMQSFAVEGADGRIRLQPMRDFIKRKPSRDDLGTRTTEERWERSSAPRNCARCGCLLRSGKATHTAHGAGPLCDPCATEQLKEEEKAA